MAKIDRAHQKVFAGGVVSTNNIAVFGSLKAAAPAFSNDPAVIQSLSAFVEGWKSAVVNNNAPALQDVNALDYLYSRQLAYVFQSGVAEWHAETEYTTNSYCQSAGYFYRSIQDLNTNHAVSDVLWWLSDIKVNSVTPTTNFTITQGNLVLSGTNALVDGVDVSVLGSNYTAHAVANTGVHGVTGNVAGTGLTLNAFANTTPTQLRSIITETVGTGQLVFAVFPTFSQRILIDGYTCSNGSGIPGALSGQHPYLAVKKLIATWAANATGVTGIEHGLAPGNQIKSVTGRIFNGVAPTYVSVPSFYNNRNLQISWNDIALKCVSLDSTGALSAFSNLEWNIEFLVTYEREF